MLLLSNVLKVNLSGKQAELGKWSLELAESACEQIKSGPDKTIREGCPNPILFLMEHQDRFQSAVLMLNGYITDFAYAGKNGDEIWATEFYLQNGPPHAPF